MFFYLLIFIIIKIKKKCTGIYICLFFFFYCGTVLFGTAHAVLYQKLNFLFNVFNEKLKYKNLLRITPQKHP